MILCLFQDSALLLAESLRGLEANFKQKVATGQTLAFTYIKMCPDASLKLIDDQFD